MKLVSYISCLYYNNISYVVAVITVAPSSVSAPIYTLANFTCEGTGVTLIWTVEGHFLTDPSNQNREISVTTNNISVDMWSSVLTIRALPINDGISITCTVISINPFDLKQKGATLTVKGKLNKLINCKWNKIITIDFAFSAFKRSTVVIYLVCYPHKIIQMVNNK